MKLARISLLVVTFANFFGLNNLERIDYGCFYFINHYPQCESNSLYWCKKCSIAYSTPFLLLVNHCWNTRDFSKREKGKTWVKIAMFHYVLHNGNTMHWTLKYCKLINTALFICWYVPFTIMLNLERVIAICTIGKWWT